MQKLIVTELVAAIVFGFGAVQETSGMPVKAEETCARPFSFMEEPLMTTCPTFSLRPWTMPTFAV
jgi:hypothetical protein